MTTKTGWKDYAARFLSDILVSAVVAGGFTVYFESRLENSREIASALQESDQKFDVAHNQIVSQIGIYTNTVLSGTGDVDKNRILTAIIDAQSQLLELKAQLAPRDYAAVDSYAHELNQLSDAVNTVKEAREIKPVLASVQRLLADHDTISERVRNRIGVSIF